MIRRNLLIILAGLIWSPANGQGIKNSHHDFTSASWNGAQACLPCHLPSTPDKDTVNVPLWNMHKKVNEYAYFSSLRTMKNTGQPGGNSKLCLSCHDGTVAREKYTGTYALNSAEVPGSSGEHPVSIAYNTAKLYNVWLNNPAATVSGLGGTIAHDLLENNYVECTSCHDVHVSANKKGCTECHKAGAPYAQGNAHVSLWKSNRLSNLCLTCHQK